MRKIFIVLVITSSLIACSSNSNNSQTADVKPISDSATVESQCYAYIQNKDTIHLNITITGYTFTGHMLYQLKERDRNDGTLHGTIQGDTLIADYTFSSEGMLSVRQVAFLKQQNNLKEGFGELKLNDNQWVFTNPHALQFTGFVLTPTPCN
jgi:hypothetical protein